MLKILLITSLILRNQCRNFTVEITRCLLNYQLYDKRSDQCYDFEEQGPCKTEETFIPDIYNVGFGKCEQLSSDCDRLTLDEDGFLECEIPNNSLFMQEHCDNGQILLPNNFVENSQE